MGCVVAALGGRWRWWRSPPRWARRWPVGLV